MSDHEADPPADQSDQWKWTIKNIPPDVRQAATDAAKRDKQQIGEWLSRAIRAQIQADRQGNRLPVPVEAPQSDPAADLSDLERMVVLAEKIAAANQAPIPPGLTRLAHGLMRDRLKALRGPTRKGTKSD